MTKLYKRVLSAGVLALALIGCTDVAVDVFETFPSENYPENDQQAREVANPAYGKLKGMTTDWGGWWMAQEITGDGVVAPTRGKDWDDGGKWRALHRHNWGPGTEAVKGIWKENNSGVVLCNQAIEILEGGTQNDEVLSILGQVKVMRAFYNYIMIDNYGDIPYVTAFKEITPENEFPSRLPRKQVFDSLVAEINEAIPYLQESADHSQVSIGTAYALLAKLYMNAEVYTGTAMYDKAEAAVDELFKLNYSLDADVSDPFLEQNEASKENIFTIPYDEDELKDFNLHMRTLHYDSQKTFNMAVQPWNGFAVVEDHFNKYTDKDLRKKWFLYGEQFAYDGTSLNFSIDPHLPALQMDASLSDQELKNSGARVVKFEIASGAKQDLSNDFPLFRLTDFYLLKAEARVRLGGNGDQWINEIRSRAGLEDLTAATLEDIYLERSLELIWEGHRRQDMIRFGKYTNDWWEKPVTQSTQNIFPVPAEQINSNKNLLPQNPGY